MKIGKVRVELKTISIAAVTPNHYTVYIMQAKRTW